MNPALASRWTDKADRDLALAAQITQQFPDLAAYHFQQAAEKHLKAVLALHQQPVPKSHSIGTLTLLAGRLDADFLALPDLADVDMLTEFATFFRYPNQEEVDFPEPLDLRQAARFCEAAQRLVLEKIAQAPGSGEEDAPVERPRA